MTSERTSDHLAETYETLTISKDSDWSVLAAFRIDQSEEGTYEVDSVYFTRYDEDGEAKEGLELAAVWDLEGIIGIEDLECVEREVNEYAMDIIRG